MNAIKILLKKDFKERISNLKNTKKDIAGLILNVILTLVVIGFFVFAFSYFIKTYSNIKLGYVTNILDRVYEILTLFYTVVLILLVVMGVTKLNKNLIDTSNLTLLSMPISPFQIFISKLFGVYLELTITSLLISIPTFLLLSIEGLISFVSILPAILFALFIPLIALMFASIFTIPFYYVKKWLNKHVIIQLIVYIVLIAIAFFVYSIFLRFVKGLLESGQISFFFNANSVYKIGKICFFLFPANIFSSLIVGKNLLLNILFLIFSTAISVVVCFYISKFIFNLVRHNKIGHKEELTVKKSPRDKRKVTVSLIAKEFLNVLRTPSLAFNYFAIVLSLPLMVVITSSLLSSMMHELTFLNCDFEIVLCSMTMFSIILNSFCANNISRDGKFFNLLKTFPITPKKIVLSKIMFCFITSLISIVVTGLALLIAGILSPLKIFAVMIIAIILNFGIICLATRKDLNTTKNIAKEENSSSLNFLIFWGLLFSIALTVISFVISLYLQTRFNLFASNMLSAFIIFILSCLVCGLSLIYLFKNLDKKFKEIIL